MGCLFACFKGSSHPKVLQWYNFYGNQIISGPNDFGGNPCFYIKVSIATTALPYRVLFHVKEHPDFNNVVASNMQLTGNSKTWST